MIIENKLELPDALVKAVSLEKHNGENEISATTLLKGVKEILLTDRHATLSPLHIPRFYRRSD